MVWVIFFVAALMTVDCSHGNGDTTVDVQSILEQHAHMITELKVQIDAINIENAILVKRMNTMEEENQLIKSKLAKIKCNVLDEENNVQSHPDVLVHDGGSVNPVKPTVKTEPGIDDAAMGRLGRDESSQRAMTEGDDHEERSLLWKQSHSNRSVLRSISGSQVGFYATLRLPVHVDLGSYQTITFDNVITNVGNGYNKLHGVFIAPVDGIYSFTAVVRVARSDFTAYLIIIKNGDVICNVFKGSQENTATGTAVLALNVGDNVYVQNTNADVTDVMANDYSFFSGFRI